MIAKEFEDFLTGQLDTYLIPADQLAIFVDTHHIDHVMLLLANNGYSRVPVITNDKKYVGTISMSDIMNYRYHHKLADWELSQTDIALAVSDKIETINLNASLTEVLHKLVDNPFLPVVTDNNSFVGIITRKAVLKAVNALLHEFTDHYSITKK